MDPYLEATAIWTDVHAGLIAAMRRQLQPRLSPRYVAVVVPYTAFSRLSTSIFPAFSFPASRLSSVINRVA
jgi:hypothetical protein